MEQLLAWDTALFLWLNGQGTSTFDPFWLMMSAKGTNVVVYLVFVFFTAESTAGNRDFTSLF